MVLGKYCIITPAGKSPTKEVCWCNSEVHLLPMEQSAWYREETPRTVLFLKKGARHTPPLIATIVSSLIAYTATTDIYPFTRDSSLVAGYRTTLCTVN